ncbi:hypothetical protein LOAG_04377 [Loa loa]|uniref:Uncharacterized protein n=1 Tax=Loa loa TaxID=7209 RepID=A0A1S0U2R5_LOALO|nr:hypothetical protein LOAG_04377 [Loa loa]EFO24111.1 hypothetical protein LOAG_04377 [Loa loa]
MKLISDKFTAGQITEDRETVEADTRPVVLLSIVFILAALSPVLLIDEVLAVERPNTFADSSFGFATCSPEERFCELFQVKPSQQTKNQKLALSYRSNAINTPFSILSIMDI